MGQPRKVGKITKWGQSGVGGLGQIKEGIRESYGKAVLYTGFSATAGTFIMPPRSIEKYCSFKPIFGRKHSKENRFYFFFPASRYIRVSYSIPQLL